MQQGSQSKTDGRSMARVGYGEHRVPKGGSSGVSVARRREDRDAIAEQLDDIRGHPDPADGES